mgnify:CR=1 FL=1
MSKLIVDGIRVLSRQESKVFRLLVTEHKSEEIAKIMGLDEKTVCTYKLRILTKFGCKTNIGLYIFSLRPDVGKFLR